MPEVLRRRESLTSPYQNTQKTAQESKIQIENLLHQYGVADFQWFEESKRLALIFVLEARGKRRVVRRVPPLFVTSEGYVRWPQVYRFLYWGLKPRLEAVEAGVDIDDEFLADIVISLQDGHRTTVGAQFSVDKLAGRIIPLEQAPSYMALPENPTIEVR